MCLKNISILFIVSICFIKITFGQITSREAFPNLTFDFPVEIQSANDGSKRLFIVEQGGLIKVFPRNEDVEVASLNTFLDITDSIEFSFGQELGLLGLAFHPNYVSNGFFYVYYTSFNPDNDWPRIRVSRFQVDPANPNFSDLTTERIIFQFDKNQDNSNHNGGAIAFGPDGFLYISIGDGGGGGDPEQNGQNKQTIFGSICRIDVDLDGNNTIETNPSFPDGRYEIPATNPFLNDPAGLDEIFAYGIRNTWKFSFDSQTGRFWGADVGQGEQEEINILENGKNYGWSRFEGNFLHDDQVDIFEATESPKFIYDHSVGVSITGGYVYRGSDISSLSPNISSKYIYGDYVSGRVWALNYNAAAPNETTSELLFKTNGQSISSFGVDDEGEIYFSDYEEDVKLYKIVDGITAEPGKKVKGIGEWKKMQEGVNGIVNAIEVAPNGIIYMGGQFSNAGGVTANNIVSWNPTTQWQAISDGSNGSVNTIKRAPNGDLYVGGSFTEIGGINANNIAVWNGTAWSALDGGINGSISAIEIDDNGAVFAAGIFETIDLITAKNIAQWNGTNWLPLIDDDNKEAGTNNEIRSLSFDNANNLYVGGNFDEAGGKSANRIAVWDGTNWNNLGDGTSGFVQAITTNGNDIYAGGNFAIAGNKTVNRIARWSKTDNEWFPIENGLNNAVFSLHHDGESLFIGGDFDVAFSSTDSVIVNHIVKWKPNLGWQAMGKDLNVGVNVNVRAIHSSSVNTKTDSLFTGGTFSIAGTLNGANNAAIWCKKVPVVNNDLAEYTDTLEIIAFPNPTNNVIYLKETMDWILLTIDGKQIKEGHSNQINLNDLYNGTYIVIDKKNSGKAKVIKQ